MHDCTFVYFINAESKLAAHWVTVSYLRTNDGSWIVYDSLDSDIFVICPNKDRIIVKKEKVSKQQNGYDCGLFALAFSFILAIGQDPKDYVI